MTFPVTYRSETDDDIAETYRHYESRRPGLGEEFLESLREQIRRISDNPEMYAILYKNVRAAPLRPFSYVVYYRIDGDMVLIVAVHHGHRSPRAWKHRT